MTLNPTLDRTLKLTLTWLRLIHPLHRSYMDRKNGKPPTDSAEVPHATDFIGIAKNKCLNRPLASMNWVLVSVLCLESTRIVTAMVVP